VLYGMIGLLGARIWIENKVDLGNPINLMTGAVALIVGIANFTWAAGDLRFSGIALGTIAAILVFHVMCALNGWTKAVPDPRVPAGTMDEPLA
jgi:xanthine/uracil permease